ncbi:MAG: type II secretion system protein [Erysipelotrichaceae bacterium]
MSNDIKSAYGTIANKKGVTLVELIVTIAIFGIILGAVGTLFVNAVRQFHNNSARMNTESIAQNIDRKLDDEMQYLIGEVGNSYCIKNTANALELWKVNASATKLWQYDIGQSNVTIASISVTTTNLVSTNGVVPYVIRLAEGGKEREFKESFTLLNANLKDNPLTLNSTTAGYAFCIKK